MWMDQRERGGHRFDFLVLASASSSSSSSSSSSIIGHRPGQAQSMQEIELIVVKASLL